ncbi:ORF48 [Fowl aviadenovirus 10]|uniref:ORF48 n=1 Tax=Fowl adenovirus C serotype 10 (strain SA2) TaxID=10547 RepID=A0A6M6R8G3_ADEGX|nr:ORF48 [Fowl aviadenovirus 10]QJZ28089.1 ORF48 [Fowl aviadenovirus 10]
MLTYCLTVITRTANGLVNGKGLSIVAHIALQTVPICSDVFVTEQSRIGKPIPITSQYHYILGIFTTQSSLPIIPPQTGTDKCGAGTKRHYSVTLPSVHLIKLPTHRRADVRPQVVPYTMHPLVFWNTS